MGKEFEVKYRAASSAVLEEILEGRTYAVIAMATTYYDTPAGALSARRWTLRLRRENDRQVITVKTPGPGLARGEWETEAQSISQGIPLLLALGAPRELEALAGEVRPVCGAEFTRRAVQLDLGDAKAELACDFGTLLGGGRTEPLCEVEVELKSGAPEAVVAWGGDLARRFGLTPEPESKFLRARRLAGGL